MPKIVKKAPHCIIRAIIVVIVAGFISSLFLSSCDFQSPEISVYEQEVKPTSYNEIIHLNNCGGKADTEQYVSRTYAMKISEDRFPNNQLPQIKANISSKYNEFASKEISISVTAPHGTNMEIGLAWEVDNHAGTVEASNVMGSYSVEIPQNVFLIYSKDLGCGQPIATISPEPTSSPIPAPVELAILNITSSPMADGTIAKKAELSIAPLGVGNIEIYYPSVMKEGESSTVRLTITPNSALTDLPRVYKTPYSASSSQNDIKYYLNFNDQVEIYPVMSAELRGINFDILSDERPEKPVISSSVVEWIWNVRPKSTGKQSLIMFISVPVIIDKAHDIISARPIKNIPIEIIVEGQEALILTTTSTLPTPTITQLPPLNRIGEKLIEDSPVVLGALITLIVGLITAYVTYTSNKNKTAEKVIEKPETNMSIPTVISDSSKSKYKNTANPRTRRK